ncbi:HD-GYP domain-containing protein [uncultured Ilyobacter sp.]|uniref:HD-GYP domain-containing protein n=1 Tax=uncultured Ilyobacter sp. TaxID=544433 RepID=UPI002AA91E21|nr:HD-GYP domain-containing protein [uncultured Ilyobacter sp.]
MKGRNSDTEIEKLQLDFENLGKLNYLTQRLQSMVMSAENEIEFFTNISSLFMDEAGYNFANIEITREESQMPVKESSKIEAFQVEKIFNSFLSLPILQGSSKLGTLNLYSDRKNAFKDEERKILEKLACDIAYGLYILQLKNERDRALEFHKEALLNTIEAFVLTMKKRDPYTAGHQKRVTELAVAIGERMGLDEKRIEGLRLGAMIHDIGKINVPGEILNRPGKITRHEFEIIKPHSQLGYEIIQGLDFPWPIEKMILQHHERIDGTGYPKGLKGEEIITEAKIIAVADVVEAISSHRPYRVALGIQAALAEIKKRKGSSFDVQIVDICVELFEKKEFHWENSHSFLENITA